MLPKPFERRRHQQQDALDARRLPVLRVIRAVLSVPECARISEVAQESGRYYDRRQSPLDRRVEFRILYRDEAAWIYERLAQVLKRENIWALKLTGTVDPMRIQRYTQGCYSGPHTDYDYTTSDYSKLTAVIPLVRRSCWLGGDLLIGNALRKPRLDQGDCVLFPSVARHEVTLVRRGVRLVLTAWMSGPPLR
jgi:predicted 2-oxoglutarate/Fe(II)-dependent dioxygenase YbiX